MLTKESEKGKSQSGRKSIRIRELSHQDNAGTGAKKGHAINTWLALSPCVNQKFLIFYYMKNLGWLQNLRVAFVPFEFLRSMLN